MNTDTVFIEWNKSTLHSLQSQIESAKGTPEMNLYQNRLEAFKAYTGLSDENSINPKSKRYLFLTVLKKEMAGKDYYVIEANKSGEKVEIRNYVVILNQSGEAEITLYKFEKEKWTKAVTQKSKLNFEADLKSYLTKFRLGFNQDDVIVTHFDNLLVKDSEYYLYSTLSSVSGIDKVLSVK